MPDNSMLKRWKRTEEYLNAVIAEVPLMLYGQKCAVGTVESCIEEAKHFIDHKELGLAYENLESIAMSHELSKKCVSHLSAAAKEMDMEYKGKK